MRERALKIIAAFPMCESADHVSLGLQLTLVRSRAVAASAACLVLTAPALKSALEP